MRIFTAFLVPIVLVFASVSQPSLAGELAGVELSGESVIVALRPASYVEGAVVTDGGAFRFGETISHYAGYRGAEYFFHSATDVVTQFADITGAWRFDAIAQDEQGERELRAGRHREAADAYRRALELKRNFLGQSHLTVAISLLGLAKAELGLGNAKEALQMQEEALAIRQDNFEPDSWLIAAVHNDISKTFVALGRFEEAAKARRLDIAIHEKHLGPNHAQLGALWLDYAKLLRQAGRVDAAARAEATGHEAYAMAPHGGPGGELEPFEKNDLYGFRTPGGKVVIPPQYQRALEFFSYGYAAVFDEQGWAYIDRQGNVIIRPYPFDNGPDYFREGLSRYVSNNKIGFINNRLEIIIPAAFDFAEPFENGISYVCNGCKPKSMGEHSVMTGGKWGVLGLDGNVAIIAPGDVRTITAGEVTAHYRGEKPPDAPPRFGAEALWFSFKGDDAVYPFKPEGVSFWEWNLDIFSPDGKYVLLLQDRYGPYHVVRTSRLKDYLRGRAKADEIVGQMAKAVEAKSTEPMAVEAAAIHEDARWLSATSFRYVESCCGHRLIKTHSLQSMAGSNTVSDPMLAYRPNLQESLQTVSFGTDRVVELVRAYYEYSDRAHRNPGRWEKGKIQEGANPREYIPSSDELILAELGGRLAEMVDEKTWGWVAGEIKPAGISLNEIRFQEFTFRHVDVMGTGRFHYASAPRKVCLRSDGPPLSCE